MSKQTTRIGIIGGGYAGLTAAYELQKRRLMREAEPAETRKPKARSTKCETNPNDKNLNDRNWVLNLMLQQAIIVFGHWSAGGGLNLEFVSHLDNRI